MLTDSTKKTKSSFFTFCYGPFNPNRNFKGRRAQGSPGRVAQRPVYAQQRGVVFSRVQKFNAAMEARENGVFRYAFQNDFFMIYKPVNLAQFEGRGQAEPQDPVERVERKREVPVWRRTKRKFNMKNRLNPDKYRVGFPSY